MITKLSGKKINIDVYNLGNNIDNNIIKEKVLKNKIELLNVFNCVIKNSLNISGNGKSYDFSDFMFCEKVHYNKNLDAIQDGFIINKENFDIVNNLEDMDNDYFLFDVKVSKFKKNLISFFDFKSKPEFETQSLDLSYITSDLISEIMLSEIIYKNKSLDFSSYKELEKENFRFIIKNDDGDFYVERKVVI